jgi:hypothetical protein
MPLQPIQTRYKGHHFRSRLEARWAVFFDALGVHWEYEPEGFDLDGTLYLPDFRVTTGDLVYWYEVKPLGLPFDAAGKFFKFQELLAAERYKDYEDATFLNTEARLLIGDPVDVFVGKHACPRCGCDVEPEAFSASEPEWGFLCYDCDAVTASGGGNPWETGFAGVPFYPHKGWIVTTFANYTLLQRKVGQACAAARSARFEHGARGAT